MQLNPKSRFLKNKPASELMAGLGADDNFHAALEAALCQMECEMPSVVNPAQDVTTASQMNGARKFIGILLNLPIQAQPIKREDPTALKY